MTSLLVHACCAPCATASVEKLIADGESPYLFFKNPNIHPFQEFKQRLDSFNKYLSKTGLPGEADEAYGLFPFLKGVSCFDKPLRCKYCYELRLEAAAARARELGIPRFTTTLTISPYQDHRLITEAGKAVAAKHGVEFECFDFRPLYRKSRGLAREAGYYLQKYCGCIFSEAERYNPEKGGAPK